MRYTDRKGGRAESEVWSPGPRARSVWLTNGVCVRWQESKSRWIESSAPDGVSRLEARHAPELSEKDWRKALDTSPGIG